MFAKTIIIIREDYIIVREDYIIIIIIIAREHYIIVREDYYYYGWGMIADEYGSSPVTCSVVVEGLIAV